MNKKIVVGIIGGLILLIGAIAATVIIIGNNSNEKSTRDNNPSASDNTEKGSSTENQNQQVKLVESGYSMNDSSAYLQFAFVIENPDEKVAYEFPTVIITAYDKDGDVLATEKQVMNKIQPGEKQAFGSFMDCHNEKPNKVEFAVESGNKIIASETAIKSSDLVISGTKERTETYGDVAFTGKVKNTTSTNATLVGVTILLRKNGKIVYGSTTYIDNLNAGKEKAFDFNEFELPEYDSYEISALNWGF